MALLARIFDFIKGLFTRPGLHTFLKKYQTAAIQVIEDLSSLHDGQSLNEWWDEAFDKFKTLVDADANNIRDNWLAIALNLAYEVFKADKEKRDGVMSDNLLFNPTKDPRPHTPFIAYKTEDGVIQFVEPNPRGELWREFMEKFAEEADREFFSVNPGLEKIQLKE